MDKGWGEGGSSFLLQSRSLRLRTRITKSRRALGEKEFSFLAE